MFPFLRCGNLDMDLFAKAYSFVEDYRQEELEHIRKEVKTLKRKKKRWASELATQLSSDVKQTLNQDKQRRHLGEMREMERSLKAGEREKVRKTGKAPYFHKRGAVRRLLVEKKKQGKTGLAAARRNASGSRPRGRGGGCPRGATRASQRERWPRRSALPRGGNRLHEKGALRQSDAWCWVGRRGDLKPAVRSLRGVGATEPQEALRQ
ncbi:unnamed protein product [Prorocentrum cordatum]|uniref:rRNA biogenesis protein RRP36 n=1 Tax=Prorocentrum cordatum TaxID=2364126 RepID=A0ABN9TIE6_9DINO|nr:unnamed protein product [Polarella glacialis]